MSVTEDVVVTAADWMKGIAFSVAASIIGGASKLAIRKSFLIEQRDIDNDDTDASSPSPAQFHGKSHHLGHHHHVLLPNRKNTEDTTELEDDESSSQDEDYDLDMMERDDENESFHAPEPPLLLPLASAHKKSRLPVCLRVSGMIGMTFLNPLCCVLAMNYASPSILAPFSGLTLVWIILFSGTVTGEQPRCKQVMACCFILVGEVVVAVFGDHTNDGGMTVHDVRQSYRHGPFLTYIGISVSCFLVMAQCMRHSRSPTLRRFVWGIAGGSLTGFQNFLKDTLTIVKAASNPDTTDEVPWGLLTFLGTMAILTSFCGLLLLTACMKRYDATYSSAMFVGSFVIMASIMSSVHYDTFAHLDQIENMVLYPTGLVILMGGVCMLVLHSKDAASPEEDGIREASLARPNSPSQISLVAMKQTPCEEEKLC